MKRFMIIAIALFFIGIGGVASARMVSFFFDPNDLIDLYGTDFTDPKETQENARRIHNTWTNDYYGTFSNYMDPDHVQPNDGNTYVNWRAGLGEGEGLSCFNTWLMDNPNARSWGEILVAKPDAPIGSVRTVCGWNAEVITNPWGAGYLVEWWTDNPDLYLRPGGADIGTFGFTVDVYVDIDADGWDEDDPDAELGETYRIWFGGYNGGVDEFGEPNYPEPDWSVHFDDLGWGSDIPAYPVFAASGSSGWEGVLEMEAVPEPGTILMILGGLAGLAGIVRRRK